MYIALVQNNPKAGDLRGNAERAIETLDVLAASLYPPDLVVFPAFALTGTPLEGLCFSDAFAAECIDVARAFMEKASLPTLIGSYIPRPLDEGIGFISEPEVLFCKDGGGGALGFVDFENDWSTTHYASSITTVIDSQSVSVLLDDFPEPDDDFLDSDIVILLLAKEYRGTNSLFTSSDQLGYLRLFAQQNNTWVVVANLVGAQDTTVFDGGSIVLKPDGSVATSAAVFAEDVLIYNVTSGVSPADSLATRDGREQTPTDEQLVKPLLPYEADWRAAQLCIHDYVHKNGFTDVVLGLSGGIDSAVCATLAVDALGAEQVHGILMPGPHSSQGSVDDAHVLAANLHIETLTLPIDKPLEVFHALFREALEQEGSNTARQNIQARIRTIHLMHLSNSFNWLLLNTGNKSEAAMGYSTLYGDTAGALAPIGNVYKTDVYGLATWRNGQHPVIPVEILEKAPSAELYDGQKDEDALPPYELLDYILRLHIEDDYGVDQILEFARQDSKAENITKELVEQVLTTVQLAEYKRRQEPMAPSLGSRDIGLDRGWPVTNGFKDHYRDLKPTGTISDYLGMIRSWDQPKGWDFLAN